ncbi:MAG: hypothetical protein GXP62_18070 [Oligoflexia bacterium]|nr:hypothetical protein [Oligoflexia bacterium]
MSFFSRLTNLGKGMWHVKVGARRRTPSADEAARLRALQQELSTKTAPTTPRTPQARLDALADDLRQGTLTREQYDAACAPILAELEGTERMAAPTAAPAAAPTAATTDPPSTSPETETDGDRVKRTL